MKRMLLLFIVVVICKVGAVAQTYQYHPLVDTITTKEWNYSCYFEVHFPPDQICLQLDYLMQGDTLINGYMYRQVVSPGAGYQGSDLYAGAVIEDSLRRVFFKQVDTGLALGDLIFDFSLQVNDTFVTPFFNPSLDAFKIQSIDTVFIAGKLRRKFMLSPIFNDTTHDVWIEGIGSLLYGLVPNSDCFLSTYNLNLEREDGNVIYSSTVPPCSITTISETNSDKFNLNLYPNPTTDLCTLEFDNIEQPFSSSIFDITGREVMPLFTNKTISTFTFNTRSLAIGVYLVKVNTEDGRSAVVKLIKQ